MSLEHNTRRAEIARLHCVTLESCARTRLFVLVFFVFCFFFSSRRRHTRLSCDWSSDVCSSDLSSDLRDYRVTGVQTCALPIDRKSTRQNSSHTIISYAVFC